MPTKSLSLAIMAGLLSGCVPYVYPTIDNHCPTSSSESSGSTPPANSAQSQKTLPSGTSTGAGDQGSAATATAGASRPNPTSCSQLPAVVKSVASLRQTSQKVEQKISDHATASTVLDVATFGLATAFAFKVVQGGALTTGAKNVALSAGAAYTAGSLFFPRSKEVLYLNADLALACVANRGNFLLSTYDDAEKTIAAGPGVGEAEGGQCSNWPRLEAEQAKAEMAKSTLRNSESGLAARLDEARVNIQSTLAQQLFAQYPSPDAVLNSGKTAAQAAATLVPAGVPFGTPITTKVLGGASCTALSQQRVNDAILGYQRVTSQISQSINAVGDLSLGCTTTVANPVKPMRVSQTAVILTAGDNNGVVLTIEGGRPSITAQWVGADPPTTDVAYVWLNADRSVRVFAPSAGKTGEYTLRISDSALVPNISDVTIKIK